MISVFLPTVRRPDSLREALDGLVRQRYRDFEVLVLCDPAEDETAEVISRYRDRLNIRVIQSRSNLVNRANEALQEARGEVFVRTDDDAVAADTWLEAVAQTFDADPRVGCVTGPTTIPLANREGRDLTRLYPLFKNGSFFWRSIGKVYLGYIMENRSEEVSQWLKSGAFTLGSNFEAARHLSEEFECTNIEACNFSARTDLLRSVGGFDPAYGGIGEYHEPDASLKIKKKGYKLIFNPRAAVEHRPSVLGIYKARPNAYSRSHNFLLFYFRHIKPATLDGWLRFFCYLAMMNAYWCWKAIVSKDLRSLGGVGGTLTGFVRYLPELARGRSAL